MKERIIGCTLELLGQIGFRRFTMDMVASELRISKRTLYLYFTSKEQLLDTCLERWLLRKRLLVPTGGILIDDLCALYAGIRKVDLRRVMHCSRELRQCCLPVYRLFQERLFNYADACGMRAEQDAGTGYLCRDVTRDTVSAVVSDFLIRLFGSVEEHPLRRGSLSSPEILIVYMRGLCTIKGRAYLDRHLKTLSRT